MTRPWGAGTPESFISVEGDVAKITLTRGQVAIVDTGLLPRLRGIKWFAVDGYGGFRCAGRTSRNKLTYLHRFITGAISTQDKVDHINGNQLDNRLSNLRICSNSDNLCNHHGPYKNNRCGALGVYRCQRTNKWRARIRRNNKVVEIGRFDSLESAVAARRKAELDIFGEFAPRSAT